MSKFELPIAHLTTGGLIKSHQNTEILGFADGSLDGLSVSDFVSMEVWGEWERQIKERDFIVAKDLLISTGTALWKSAKRLTRRGDSLLLESLEIEQLEGKAIAAPGWVLGDQEKRLYSWLEGLPEGAIATWWDALGSAQVPPLVAERLVVSFEGEERAERARQFSGSVEEVFEIFPRIEKVQARAGRTRGRVRTRAAVPRR